MKQELFNTFGLLCESLVKEASAIISAVPPHVKPLVQYLHKNYRLPHDMGNYELVDRINWATIKGQYGRYSYGSHMHWVILVGTKGSACIMPIAPYGEWRVVVHSNVTGEINVIKVNRINEAVDMVKRSIGSISKKYVCTGKMTKEKDKKVVGPRWISDDELVKKLKPTFLKSMKKAVADVRGMLLTQIKNDAYDRAQKRIERLTSLLSYIELMENHNNYAIPQAVEKWVKTALLMTASKYYPDITGNINVPSNSSYIHSQHQKGPLQVAMDIYSGDMEKLGTVLYYFRREMIAV